MGENSLSNFSLSVLNNTVRIALTMSEKNPIEKSKDEFKHIIEKIGINTGVGIDAQLTHAIIIEYLQGISKRLDKIEQSLKQ